MCDSAADVRLNSSEKRRRRGSGSVMPCENATALWHVRSALLLDGAVFRMAGVGERDRRTAPRGLTRVDARQRVGGCVRTHLCCANWVRGGHTASVRANEQQHQQSKRIAFHLADPH